MSINTNQSSEFDIDELFNRVNPRLREQMKLHSSQKSKNKNKPSNSIALTEAKDLDCEFALEELSGKVSHPPQKIYDSFLNCSSKFGKPYFINY